eukprot:925769-Pyramimonas_sp.AAC.1
MCSVWKTRASEKRGERGASDEEEHEEAGEGECGRRGLLRRHVAPPAAPRLLVGLREPECTFSNIPNLRAFAPAQTCAPDLHIPAWPCESQTLTKLRRRGGRQGMHL